MKKFRFHIGQREQCVKLRNLGYTYRDIMLQTGVPVQYVMAVCKSKNAISGQIYHRADEKDMKYGRI